MHLFSVDATISKVAHNQPPIFSVFQKAAQQSAHVAFSMLPILVTKLRMLE